MHSINLEICAFSLDACVKAEEAGANRIELCAGAAEGGTTPPYSLIKEANRIVSIPIVPIIRPRGGDFNYSSREFDLMKEDIKIAKDLGCFGVALSILKENNTVNIERTQALVNLAAPLQVTFVRGFDLTPDPKKSLDDIIETGCKRILTSGQSLKAEQNIPLLKELIAQAGNRISIMPGSGINNSNIKKIASETGAYEYHASARTIIHDEKMTEYGFGNSITCNKSSIKQMREILNKLQ